MPDQSSGLTNASYPLRYILLLFSLQALLLVTAAQQQPPVVKHGLRRSPHENAALKSPGIYKQQPPQASQPPHVQVSHKRGRSTNPSENERAVATLAPADPNPAVRAPPAKPAAGPSGGLTSAQRARSLQDWEVENFVLLATVDGKIHARHRKAGKQDRWVFTPTDERPMVDTIYHRQNNSVNDGTIEEHEYLWIVEPTQDGALYLYTPQNKGIQKLDLTIKQLAEQFSPYSSQDPPITYTADKKSTLYTLNAGNGKLIKEFSAAGSIISDQGSCKPAQGFEGLEDEECESSSTVMIGRTEYTVTMHNETSGAPICTIRYFEWTPNNRDRDLQNQYKATMDNTYIYSQHDGRILTMDHSPSTFEDAEDQRPIKWDKLSSPVVRVYDIARPLHSQNKDTQLVVLPQPLVVSPEDDTQEDIFVNCTESGGWYAMSEKRYPGVTRRASKAECYNNNWNGNIDFWRGEYVPQKSELVGVHSLSELVEYNDNPLTISGPEEPLIAEPIESVQPPLQIDSPNPPVLTQSVNSRSIFALLIILFAFCIPGYKFREPIKQMLRFNMPKALTAAIEPSSTGDPKTASTEQENKVVPETEADVKEGSSERTPEAEAHPDRKVRFATSDGEKTPSEPPAEGDAESPLNDPENTNGTANPDGVDGNGDTPKPKKKAHRGQRGGRRRRKKSDAPENEDEGVIERVKQIGKEHSMQPDEISVNGEGIQDVTGSIKLNNLEIRTDRVLGYGSGGTCVFEGAFEGRNVAVKRMLPQYFELASQEISLLQQSDDHPNVVRYFCHQQDSNFLYIAVELCQASLWDLYKEGGIKDGLTDEQMQLVNEINTNVPDALFQLAAGLAHLHSLRIIHRDIKPQNILVAYPKKNQLNGPRFVISDFGLCKSLPDNISTLHGTTGNAGTTGWKAPELIMQPKDSEGRNTSSQGHSGSSTSSNETISSGVKRAVDIFSLGCVFYYVLTNGLHPFDDDKELWYQLRELNIKRNKPFFNKLKDLGGDAEEPMQLIQWMLKPKPELRPSANQVLNHPFFWSPAKRLNFLCDVSDHWERECRDPPSQHLLALEDRALDIIANPVHNNAGFFHPPDFLAKLDKKFIDTLGKQRKYTGDRMLDLLRALRNKKNHYADMPEDVKARVGSLPEGYLRYWTGRFPRLVMGCWHVVRECGLEHEPRFRPYLEGGVR
ncbi:hypothetical protein K402DRAFT_363106 [Aulographum hederae CBS 113979]|uniref:non-specific serine/threonine protein kinase n=1 Tax=Aulographum hederae CBS 113979 TaxID=1176131 RepID=A0A6G1GNQ0_9PEZI|nr:hypothetical protein K402DRAFT_363106 [Aulographum hederae CBS 113979]